MTTDELAALVMVCTRTIVNAMRGGALEPLARGRTRQGHSWGRPAALGVILAKALVRAGARDASGAGLLRWVSRLTDGQVEFELREGRRFAVAVGGAIQPRLMSMPWRNQGGVDEAKLKALGLVLVTADAAEAWGRLVKAGKGSAVGA